MISSTTSRIGPFEQNHVLSADADIYVPIEPADPFVEAIRTAIEIDAELVFADPDSGERPHLKDAYPDPYAIRHIGIEKYVEAYRSLTGSELKT